MSKQYQVKFIVIFSLNGFKENLINLKDNKKILISIDDLF